MKIKEKFKPVTKILDYAFIVLLLIVVTVGFYEFVSILYNQIITGKIEFMSLLGSLFIVLIGLELLKISVTVKRGTSFYIVAILDIVMIALARKLVLLSPKDIIDIYEGFLIVFAMIATVIIIKFMPEQIPIILKRTSNLFAIIKDEVGSLNKITNILKDYDINIIKISAKPIGDGKTMVNALLDTKNSLIRDEDLERILKGLDNVFEVKIEKR